MLFDIIYWDLLIPASGQHSWATTGLLCRRKMLPRFSTSWCFSRLVEKMCKSTLITRNKMKIRTFQQCVNLWELHPFTWLFHRSTVPSNKIEKCFFNRAFFAWKNWKETCGDFRKDLRMALGVSVCFSFSGGLEVCLSSGGWHDQIRFPRSVGGRQLDLRSRCQEGGLPPQQARGTHLEQDTSFKRRHVKKNLCLKTNFFFGGGKLDPKISDNKKFVIPISWVFLQVATWRNAAATGGWWKFHVLATRWGKGGQGWFGVLLAVPGRDGKMLDFLISKAMVPSSSKGGTFGSACQNLKRCFPVCQVLFSQVRKDKN